MTIDPTQISQWGNFSLIPSEGWKLGKIFIDHASGLLIANENPVDTSAIQPNEFGTRLIPNNAYVVDPGTGRILPPEEWRQKFDYQPREYLIPDTTFKIVYERKQNVAGNTDFVEEVLIDVASGDVISISRGVAFSAGKRKSVYEQYLHNQELRQKEKDREATQLSLQTFFFQMQKQLKPGDVLTRFYDQQQMAFRLQYEEGVFWLQEGDKLPADYSAREGIRYNNNRSFRTIEQAWQFIRAAENWYMTLTPFGEKVSNGMLAKFVIEQGNRIRFSTAINWDQYRAIRVWENQFHTESIRPSEFIQICPNCTEFVSFAPRYPTYLCNECRQLITDREGRPLDFYNTSIGGGCQGYYKGSKEKYEGNICFIGDRECIAEEARFGGIVIQMRGA